MAKPDYHGAKHRAIAGILSRLDPILYPFHNWTHTDDTIKAAEWLASRLDIVGEPRLILLTGAAYHDTGFVRRYWNNEPDGVEIAKANLPNFSYSRGQIEAVGKVIMATKVPQTPKTLVEKAMCDADLDNLGTEYFWLSGDKLLRERLIHANEIPRGSRPPKTWEEWYTIQLEFLRSHEYHTKAAHGRRNRGKQINMQELEAVLRRM